MKMMNSIALASALLSVCGVGNAANIKSYVPFTEDYVVNTYVAAVTRGDVGHINSVIDVNAKFNMLEAKKIVTFSKQDEMNFLNSNKGIQQDCTVTANVVENNADNAVVEVDMQYADHVRKDYVTMVNTANGWKITDVYSVIK